MGCFGYICKGCGTPVNGNELCIMKHVRHSEVLGEVVGHYNEYGGVIEQEGRENAFRSEGDNDPNSHYEICQSEFSMNDSREDRELRMYKGKKVDIRLYQLDRDNEILDKWVNNSSDEANAEIRHIGSKEFEEECKEEFKKLQLAPQPETHSGIAAWHKKCYDEATEEERNNLAPSDLDPEQSWGEAREEFK